MENTLLRQYERMTAFLGAVLGPDYEIVLFDRDKICRIVNGEISGRRAGDPLPKRLTDALERGVDRESGEVLNHRVLAANGRNLRCSDLFLQDEQGRTVGVLSIDFDDNRFKELSEAVFRLCHPDDYADQNISVMIRGCKDQEIFCGDIAETADEIFRRVVKGQNVAPERLNYDEKLEIVRQLYAKGIFELRGAVQAVEKKLGCSQATIYRYITTVKAERENG